jgi:hypothetical protein
MSEYGLGHVPTCYEACERMANSENTFVLGFRVTWHVVHMVTICMRTAGNSASTTYTQHHSLSTQGAVSHHAAISLLIGNLLLTCIVLLTKCANSGNFKGSLALLSLIPLRDQLYLIAVAVHESLIPHSQLYLIAVVMQASLIPLRDQLCLTAAGLSLSLISRDQLCQLAVKLSTSLIRRDQLCLLALHLSSQGVC